MCLVSQGRDPVPVDQEADSHSRKVLGSFYSPSRVSSSLCLDANTDVISRFSQ